MRLGVYGFTSLSPAQAQTHRGWQAEEEGTALGYGGVRPLTDERVAWKGPSGER